MKLYHLVACVAAAVFLQGCASYQNDLVLDPIGPPPDPAPNSSQTGTLVVFSALDVHAHFNDSPYQRHYTDYKIFSEDGGLLQVVCNNIEGVSGCPRAIELRPGRYRVIARANGYESVTIPILVAAHKVTTIHLEGGSSSTPIGKTSSNAVRLPDSRIAGWAANLPDTVSSSSH